ncbi:hypothetical protein WA026_022264 [Henosepilachna vigintioctopunctata]|uniref:Uncharacterized protein n=1 Tax=Henosepilachna vigintioctopunctata TaxID=420089 RepID=A0AAW1UGB4_9CUCU
MNFVMVTIILKFVDKRQRTIQQFLSVFFNFFDMKRFGTSSGPEIDKEIEDLTPQNTVKTHKYVWKQFSEFCERRNYKLCAQASEEQLASIFKDWAFNMKRADGTEYEEDTIRTIWNISAKLVQKKFYEEFNRETNPFRGVIFEDARKARAAKRKKLQAIPEKRKTNSVALKAEEISKIISIFEENAQLTISKQNATIMVNPQDVLSTYNTIFSKTAQGGEKHTAEYKWLTPNKNCEDKCPVRLLKKMLSKRTSNIKTNRLFSTPNPEWQKTKNMV